MTTGVDAEQTLATLLTKFADANMPYAAKDDAQNFRNLLSSLVPSHASLNVATPAATTITTGATFYLAAGTFAEFGTPRNFAGTTAGRLTYNGLVTRRVKLRFSGKITGNTAADIVQVQIKKNGTTLLASSLVSLVVGTNGFMCSIEATDDAAPADYYELFVTSATNGATVTISQGNFSVLGFLNA